MNSDQKNEPNKPAENGGKKEKPSMAQNPNPRANENIKTAPFEKTKETSNPTTDVGTEITDGEGG